MAKILLTCILLISIPFLRGQNIQILQSPVYNDSSYYHLVQISDNEFWACGEKGVLTSFDSSGNFKKLPFHLAGKNILKAKRFENIVFFSTDDATLFKYNFLDSILTQINLKGFEFKCFYDFQIAPNGKVLLCGGNTAIARGQKKIPKGFIALTDTSFIKPRMVWKSFRKFPWSICAGEGGKYYATVFNGFNSCVMVSSDLSHWKKYFRLKGLIYQLESKNGNLHYTGAPGFTLTRSGLVGIAQNSPSYLIPNSGCIWSQEITANLKVFCSEQGCIYMDAYPHPPRLLAKLPTTAYDMMIIATHRILIVGHGMFAALLNY